MLRKRLIGVITVKKGWAVQSFGYARYMPLGRVQCLAENLDRWRVDEIMIVCIDRTRLGLGPDLSLLRLVGELGLATPLTYGGGIRNVQDAASIVQLGADRICVDALVHDGPDEVRKISALLGAQAVIASLPVSRDGTTLWHRDYRDGSHTPLSADGLPLLREGVISEALIVDWRHEGTPGSFDEALVDHMPMTQLPLIVFGGISTGDQLSRLLERPQVTAVCVGNFLSYREHAVQQLKQPLIAAPLRSRMYATGVD